jgi:hypothetical protein
LVKTALSPLRTTRALSVLIESEPKL